MWYPFPPVRTCTHFGWPPPFLQLGFWDFGLKKEVEEFIFSWKITQKIHPKIFFNDILVTKADSQKYLVLHLDSKLMLTKVSETIDLLRKFQ